jgi:hypothetical protein
MRWGWTNHGSRCITSFFEFCLCSYSKSWAHVQLFEGAEVQNCSTGCGKISTQCCCHPGLRLRRWPVRVHTLTGLISKSWESYANTGVFAKQVTTTLAWRVFPWRTWLLLYRILLICAITYVYFSWIGIRIHIQLIYAFLSRRLDLTCNFGLGLVVFSGAVCWLGAKKSCSLCCKTTNQHAICFLKLFMLWESYKPLHELGGASAPWVCIVHMICLAQVSVWWHCRLIFLLLVFLERVHQTVKVVKRTQACLI